MKIEISFALAFLVLMFLKISPDPLRRSNAIISILSSYNHSSRLRKRIGATKFDVYS